MQPLKGHGQLRLLEVACYIPVHKISQCRLDIVMSVSHQAMNDGIIYQHNPSSYTQTLKPR